MLESFSQGLHADFIGKRRMVACSPHSRQGETLAETGKQNEIGCAARDGFGGALLSLDWMSSTQQGPVGVGRS